MSNQPTLYADPDCDRCDGVGWYEGGKCLQTECECLRPEPYTQPKPTGESTESYGPARSDEPPRWTQPKPADKPLGPDHYRTWASTARADAERYAVIKVTLRRLGWELEQAADEIAALQRELAEARDTSDRYKALIDQADEAARILDGTDYRWTFGEGAAEVVELAKKRMGELAEAQQQLQSEQTSSGHLEADVAEARQRIADLETAILAGPTEWERVAREQLAAQLAAAEHESALRQRTIDRKTDEIGVHVRSLKAAEQRADELERECNARGIHCPKCDSITITLTFEPYRCHCDDCGHDFLDRLAAAERERDAAIQRAIDAEVHDATQESYQKLAAVQRAEAEAACDVFAVTQESYQRKLAEANGQLEAINALAREYGFGQGELDSDLAGCVRKIVGDAIQRAEAAEKRAEQLQSLHTAIGHCDIRSLPESVAAAWVDSAAYRADTITKQEERIADLETEVAREKRQLTAAQAELAAERAAHEQTRRELEQCESDLEDTRHSRGFICCSIKAVLGLENWPTMHGPFTHEVSKLLHRYDKQQREQIAQLQQQVDGLRRAICDDDGCFISVLAHFRQHVANQDGYYYAAKYHVEQLESALAALGSEGGTP